eukprot:scaffold67814_cov32-Tisochrysis_lutea.AAC.1
MQGECAFPHRNASEAARRPCLQRDHAAWVLLGSAGRTCPALPIRSSCGVPGGATTSPFVHPHPWPQSDEGPPELGDWEQTRLGPPGMPP